MESHNPTRKLKNVDILSFDGGGSRGIMEVSILSDVMRLATILWRDPTKLSYFVGDEDVSKNREIRERLIGELSDVSSPLHPNEIYDMIVGTSTGALIAFGLVGGNSNKDGKRLPMTLEECIEMYKDKTKKIFTKSWTQWFLSKIPGFGSIPITTYPKDNVKDVLLEQFNDCSLADFLDNKPIAGAVARQIGQKEELVLFDTKTDAYKLYKTYQVLQATSAAPVYFDTPVKIGDKEFVDGGVGGNCPLAQAIPRAKEIFGDEVAITSALSIAPPSPKESHVPHRFQVKYWLNYFVEMSTNGYAVYLDAKKRHKSISFRRLSPRGKSLKDFKLDETNAEKMLEAMNDQKLNNGMFLVDVIATAAVVVNTYLGKTAERSEMTVEMGARLAYMAGKIYSSQSEYGLAYGSYNTSKSLWKKLANRNDETKAAITKIYDEIGECLQKQGKYQQASNLYRQSVDHWRKYSDIANIAKASFNLAECLLLSSRHKEAQEELESVLELQRKLYGEDKANPEVARTLNRIGWCHREQGNFDMAIKSYLAALEMRKQLYPNKGDHLDIAETLNSLGLTHSELGKNVKAVNYAQDSLEMRRRLIKERIDSLIAESLNNLGCCLMGNEKYKEAQANLEMALKMKRELHRDVDHPSIAITLENFAKCLLYVKKDDPDLALEYANQALQMKKVCLGDVSNAAIAKTLQIVGLCFEKAGKLQEATRYFKASMNMIELSFDPTHPKLVRILSNLGQSLLNQGKYEEARFYFNKAMLIEIQRNPDSESQASLAENLKKCAEQLGEPKEKVDYYRKQAAKDRTL